ncbi:MAG: lipoxygenase family protein [Pseudomonadota bacterium]
MHQPKSSEFAKTANVSSDGHPFKVPGLDKAFEGQSGATNQAPANPTLPQNDTPAEQQARKTQLASTQTVYEWTQTIPSLPGVPAVKDLPKSELPTLEWAAKLLRVVLDLAKNQLAIEESKIAKGLAVLDPLIIAADKAIVAEAEKLVAKVEAEFKSSPVTKSNWKTKLEEAAEVALGDAVIADLKNYSEKLARIVERGVAMDEAAGSLDPRSLEDYRDIFKTIDLPPIGYTFEDDMEFARLRVAGPNSVLIEAVSAVPLGCPVTAEQYEAVVAGDTLQAALNDGRLFQCDYKDLATLDAGTWNSEQKYITCPIALFALPPEADALVPVAINCDPSNVASPVITPSLANDKQWAWQMAKFCVQVADGNYHELYAHLARTHLVIEAVAVATHRQLAEEHPIWALLVRHFEGTLFINEAAATSLITAGGPIDHIFAGTITSSQETAATARLTFNFTEGMLPTDLTTFGVGTDSTLTDYPYRDDALLVWDAIQAWVTDYVGVYYVSDSDVAGDTELAAWAADIASTDKGNLVGFNVPTTITELVDICTMIIFTGSAQHASVNFPQKAVMEFAPAVTGSMWQASPDTALGKNKSDWLAMMPPQELAAEQLKVLFLLGSIYYRPLGTYLSPEFPYPQWFQDPKIIGKEGPLEKFNANLKSVEEQIAKRNLNRKVPYEFLLPSNIPSSTNI